ncbi:MAG: MFS transporter [Nitrososphaerales archaeon]|nr:MFS transporter [Nitrososphaerales archaeon]
MSERPSYGKLFRDRSFGSLWLAQLISQSGDAVFDVALLWLVLVTTGSVALVGVTQAAVLLPSVLAGPIAGVYADRLNRRNLMIASNLVQGVVTAVLSVLYLAGALNFPFLILLVLLLYTAAQFFRAANGAIIPRIVARENLGAANGLFTLTTSANQLASYTVGGVILAAVGAVASITYDSLTFFLAAALLSFIARSYGQSRAEGAPAPLNPGFRKEFREGLAYVKQSRLFLELIVFGILVNFLGGGIAALTAPYVRNGLHGDALAYGILLSSFALGAIVGSVLLGKVNFRVYVGKLLFVGVIAAGLLIALAGLATSVPEGLVIFFAIGAVEASLNLPIQVLVQTQVPGELLGRAFAVLGSSLAASQPIAAIVFGALAEASGVGYLFTATGVGLVIVTAALYVPFGSLRSARY